MTIAQESPDLATVTVSNVPTTAFLALYEHLEVLIGELSIAAARVADRRPAPPERLQLLLDGLSWPFSALRQAARTGARHAVASGRTSFTLALELPASVGLPIELWNRLLDEADWACGHGVLLTMPMAPELVDLRRWIGARIGAALGMPGG